jgi:hypothetical protein
MGEVQRMQDGLADIGIGMPRQGAEPCFDGVERLANGREAAAIDNPFSDADMFVDGAPVFMRNGDGGGNIAIGDQV